jgi:hypothetical protein
MLIIQATKTPQSGYLAKVVEAKGAKIAGIPGCKHPKLQIIGNPVKPTLAGEKLKAGPAIQLKQGKTLIKPWRANSWDCQTTSNQVSLDDRSIENGRKSY